MRREKSEEKEEQIVEAKIMGPSKAHVCNNNFFYIYNII